MLKKTLLAAIAAVAFTAAGAADAAPFHSGVRGPIGHGPVVQGHAFRRGPAFRGAAYRGPGFAAAGFQRWGYGSFVPRAWLIPANFIADFAYYDLAAPPPDFAWVQDGPDALLVNLSTGMVAQVVPGAFA